MATLLKDQRVTTLAQQVIALFSMLTFALMCWVGYMLTFVIPDKFDRLPEKYVLRVEIDGKISALVNQIADIKANQISQGNRIDRIADEQNRRSFYFPIKK